ncbi:unnamed protein product, partial [Thlaspi arvense]
PEAMKHYSTTAASSKNPVKFRIPTAENLVPIRLDIEIDGQRFRDAFTWNPSGLNPLNSGEDWERKMR